MARMCGVCVLIHAEKMRRWVDAPEGDRKPAVTCSLGKPAEARPF